jgi:hypothetical protein
MGSFSFHDGFLGEVLSIILVWFVWALINAGLIALEYHYIDNWAYLTGVLTILITLFLLILGVMNLGEGTSNLIHYWGLWALCLGSLIAFEIYLWHDWAILSGIITFLVVTAMWIFVPSMFE